jgi:hypothetical protein
MFGFMAMNFLEFICRLCQADPSKKALLDFSNELYKIKPKYFTHLPNDPKNKLLEIKRGGFTLPYLNPKNNDNLLLTVIYDLIRNGVAHQYDQPIVDLLLDAKKLCVIVTGPGFRRQIDGRRRRDPLHLSCELDTDGNIGLKVYPDILLRDFKKAVKQSKILGKNLMLNRFVRKYNTNIRMLESNLKAGGHRFT